MENINVNTTFDYVNAHMYQDGGNESSKLLLGNDIIYPLLQHQLFITAIYSLAYGLIFLTSLVGNSLIIAVVFRNSRMRSVTNYFVVNLAIADILVALFCIPLTLLDSIFTGWRFGAFLCKVTPYIQNVSVCASINTLVVIAVDRYLAICNTWQSRIITTRARGLILFIWIISLIIALPLALFYEKFDREYGTQVVPMCYMIWPTFELQKVYFVVGLFMLCYTIPLSFIIVCYILITIRVLTRDAPGTEYNTGIIQKSKIKVLKMFGTVVSLFAMSWLPLYVIHFKLYYNPPQSFDELDITFNILVPIFQWLGLSNSAVNPLIYCFFSKKYRHGIKSIISCNPYSRLFQGNTNNLSNNTRPAIDSSSLRNDSNRSSRTYAPAKFMSVQYSHGQMTVSFRKDE